MKLVYFVHDLNDPAVHRRMRMLHAGGAVVSLIGFHRGAAPAAVDGVVPRPLGRTADARLWQRAVTVLGAALSIPRWRSLFAGAEAIVARQLETLVLASLARRLLAPSVPLIFECLDIHRLMGAPGLAGRMLRAVERHLLARCQRLVVSSPHFVRAHFARVHRLLPDVTLIENKALAFEFDAPQAAGPAAPVRRPLAHRLVWRHSLRPQPAPARRPRARLSGDGGNRYPRTRGDVGAAAFRCRSRGDAGPVVRWAVRPGARPALPVCGRRFCLGDRFL